MQQQHQPLRPFNHQEDMLHQLQVYAEMLGVLVHTATVAAVAALLRRNVSPHQTSAAISRSLSATKQSSVSIIPASSIITAVRQQTPPDASRSPSQSPESNDDELCSVVDKVEQELKVKSFWLLN